MEQTLLPGRVSSAGIGKRIDPGFSPGLGMSLVEGLIFRVLVTLPHQAFGGRRSHYPEQLVIAQNNHLRLDSPVGEVYRRGQVVKFKNGFFQNFVVHFRFAPPFSTVHYISL